MSRSRSGDMTRSGNSPRVPDTRAIDRESRRVIREDLLGSLLVEAGAGSGKTQMLAERMAAGVAAGVYDVEHMAAVTFTRKAASELRGRFQHALEARLSGVAPTFRSAEGLQPPAPSPQPDEARARIDRALSNIEHLFAGTIHSFCARLLRERPVESGVSPGFTELDEIQDIALRKRAWREFIAQMRLQGDREMMALLDAGIRPPDLDNAFAIVCGNDDVEFPPGDGTCPDPKPAWRALEAFWRTLEKELPRQIASETTCPIQGAARTFRSQLRVSRRRVDRPNVVAELLKTWDCKSEITQNRWAETPRLRRHFRDLINPLHAQFKATVVEPYLSQWRQYVYRLSVGLLTRARQHAADERRRRNTLNYGDLLTLTARVLRENAQVRRALQRKYRHLFVDEFQDTDPIQAEILFLLAADECEAGGGSSVVSASRRTETGLQPPASSPQPDWRRIALRPGSLFIVGDPKQSIYRFRRADIEIYNIVRSRFEDPSIGRVLPLTMNFRSEASLCEWANGVFAGRFPSETTRYSPKFAALDPKEEDSKTVRGARLQPCEKSVFTLSHTSDDAKEVAREDAERIARYIRAEVDAGRRRYKDFLILTRRKKDRLAPYADALEALNVPIEVSGAGAFGQSREVEALTVLLRALADPQDALSLVAVLRGPLFGISDRELFAYKQSGGWFSIFAGSDVGSGLQPRPTGTNVGPGLPPSREATADRRSLGGGGQSRPTGKEAVVGQGFSPADTPVASALASLRQYHRWTRLLPAAAALDRILEHSGYLAAAATTPGGVEAGDLLHAVDRVRQVFEDGGSLADAADTLEADAEEASSEIESLPLEPGRTDVVRVMNLHKAKGLEADVVFLADPCGGFKPRVDVHIAREGDVPQGWFQIVRKSENSWSAPVLGEHADWDAHEQAERPFLDAEEDRLLYVAATRAREMLVVSRSMGRVKSTPAWGALNGALAGAPELPVPSSVSAPAVAVPSCSARAQQEAGTARAAAHVRAKEPSWSITSVTAETRHVATMARAAEPVDADDVTRVVVPDTPSHRADAGAAWGTLIHGLLEHAMRHEHATHDDLRRLAMWLTVEEPQLRAVIDEAIDTVLAVRDADFWREARAAEHSVETPFTVAQSERSLLSGVIDLFFAGEGGWRVVDYKTDVSLARDEYESQLAAYERALKACRLEISGLNVHSVRVHHNRRDDDRARAAQAQADDASGHVAVRLP